MGQDESWKGQNEPLTARKMERVCLGMGNGTIAFLVASPEKFQAGKMARTQGHRVDLSWQRDWFAKVVPLCRKCSRVCKQSIHAKVIICPQFDSQKKGQGE